MSYEVLINGFFGLKKKTGFFLDFSCCLDCAVYTGKKKNSMKSDTKLGGHACTLYQKSCCSNPNVLNPPVTCGQGVKF